MENNNQEKRTAIAILLSILVIVIYNELIMPKPPAPTKEQQVATATQSKEQAIPTPPPVGAVQNPTSAAPTSTIAQTTTNVAATTPNRIPTKAEYEASETFTVETELVQATFSKLGGRLQSYRLKNFKTSLEDDTPLELVSVKNNTFPLGVYVSGIQDAATSYQIPQGGITAGASKKGDTYSPPSTGELSVVLEGVLPNGNSIRKTLRFVDSRYIFDVQVSLGAPTTDGSPVWLEWANYLDPQDPSLSYNPRHFVSIEPNSDILRNSPDSLDEGVKELATQWTAFGGSYFQTAVLNQEGGQNTGIGKFGDTYFMRSRGNPTGGSFSLLAGPKDRNMLREYGKDLHRTVDLGWFAFIGEPILHGIHSLYGVLGNYGLAIVLLTLLIKTALLPLTKTSFKSMKAMQDLQPEIKALRERVKDPNQLNQEVMALYQKRGVNPLGGCFPMVLQMPIFLGMYNALQRDIDLRHAPFALWVNDLSAPEGLDIFGIAVPVMIILMGASMLFQQVTTPSGADPAQKKAMYVVPVIFTGMFIVYPFPSGLVLYWLTNNLISIVQQMALRSEEGSNPLKSTLIGGVVVFVAAFVLTLF